MIIIDKTDLNKYYTDCFVYLWPLDFTIERKRTHGIM